MPASPCPGGIEATFVQMGAADLHKDATAWARELAPFRWLGIHTILLQYSGDERGGFDDPRAGREPVRALLAAAKALDLRVFLGLYADPRWPGAFPVDAMLPPPLDRPGDAWRLAETCHASPACAGWYVPGEIDDRTWAGRTASLRGLLGRTSRELRRLAPGLPIAVAPFFTGARSPVDHAAFWRELLAGGAVDVLLLQDGAGSGHGGALEARRMLDALRPVAREAHVQLWSTVELFRQIHGPPRDGLPFVAVPADPDELSRRLDVERGAGVPLAAFSVLDYMDPRRGDAAARLMSGYARWCAARRP